MCVTMYFCTVKVTCLFGHIFGLKVSFSSFLVFLVMLFLVFFSRCFRSLFSHIFASVIFARFWGKCSKTKFTHTHLGSITKVSSNLGSK